MLPEENAFDKFSKRLAVAVSRRSLLRTLSLAVAGAFLPWRNSFGQVKRPISAELESKLFIAPRIIELRVADRLELRCIATAIEKVTTRLALGSTSSNYGECPTDTASYFENSNLKADLVKDALFEQSEVFNTRRVDGRTYMIGGYPLASFFSSVNPANGKEEFEAFCSVTTKLDRRVHKGEVDQKVIYYKRKPIPEKLTSLEDAVTCGDINYAYENEIKTRKPVALRDFTFDVVPHQQSTKRVNATGTSTGNHSGHKSK